MFEEIQVPDISSLIDENTTLVVDSDGIAFKAASIAQESYCAVTEVATGITKEFKNKTEFKGGLRKEGAISADSYLGTENFKRVSKGLNPFALDDFTFEDKLRKKLPFSVVQKAIDNHITDLCNRLGVKKYKLTLGGGENFRHELPAPKRYKSNRDGSLRPLLLTEAREYILHNHPSMLHKGEIEADDIVSIYGFAGHLGYKKTGKYSYIIAAEDKDAFSVPSLLFNWGRVKQDWKYDYAFQIPDMAQSIGGADLIKGDIKGFGLLQLCHQMLTGDTSDEYFAFKHINTHPDFHYGSKECYQDFLNLKTPKETLELVLSVYKRAFSHNNGIVEFVSWDGNEVSMPYYEWAGNQFLFAYMKRKQNDNTRLSHLLKASGVDIKKMVNDFRADNKQDKENA